MFAFALDWHDQVTYYYLAGAGGLVLLLSIGLYAVPGKAIKVPGIALSIVGGLGLGLAAGVILMGYFGYQLREPTSPGGGEGGGDGPPQGMQPGGMMGGMGGGRGGGPPGGMMGGMGGGMMGGMGGGRGGGAPNYKGQLASLVGKLDVLTDKPLTIQLTAEQKKELNAQLKGLDGDDLSDDDAKAKFEKLKGLLKDQTPTLEAAGYRWPPEGGGGRGGGPGGRGGGGRGGADQPANPFKTQDNEKHLKALTERLGK